VGLVETSPADGALHIADLLARRDRVNAHLLGVVPPLAFPLALVLPVEYETVEDARRQQLLAQVRQRLSQTLGVAAYWSTEAHVGHLAAALAQASRARGSSLIVLGLPDADAPHRTALEDAVLQVIRAVDVPVLVVPPRCTRLPRRAIVAMDFSEASRRAARTAMTVLAAGATITLAHVEPEIDFAALGKPGWEAIYTRGVDELSREVVGELRAANRVGVETVVLRGEVAPTLLAFAREGAHDLIVAGTQGITPLDRHLVGSVSTALLRGAPGMVLIAPTPASS
jgi:nucleotide-binding universal stress UspA family protein